MLTDTMSSAELGDPSSLLGSRGASGVPQAGARHCDSVRGLVVRREPRRMGSALAQRSPPAEARGSSLTKWPEAPTRSVTALARGARTSGGYRATPALVGARRGRGRVRCPRACPAADLGLGSARAVGERSADGSRAQPCGGAIRRFEMREIAATRTAAGLTPRYYSKRWPTRSLSATAPKPVSSRGHPSLSATLDDGNASLEAEGPVSTADRRSRSASSTRDELFVMPNPWDVGSAQAPRRRGLRGARDDEPGIRVGDRQARSDRDARRARRARRRACCATPLPLNVDSERCYPDDPGGVAETDRLSYRLPAPRGFSIEDYDPA